MVWGIRIRVAASGRESAGEPAGRDVVDASVGDTVGIGHVFARGAAGISRRLRPHSVSGWAAVFCLVAGLFSAAWVLARLGGTYAAATFCNLAEVTTALFATYACLRAARGLTGPARRAWAMLGIGMLSWTAGQLVWTWYESVRQTEVPFPSLADAGYLGLVPFALAGMVVLISVRRRPARILLDGLLIAGSLLYVSWATVLGPMFHKGDPNYGAAHPDLSAFRWAFALQYFLWAVGAVQVVRYRNAVRRNLRRVSAGSCP